MFKRIIGIGLLLLAGTSCGWGQIKALVQHASRNAAHSGASIRPRVKGADVPGHFVPNTPGYRWGKTYLLNEKFKYQLAQEVERNLIEYEQNPALLGERPVTHPESLRGRILNPYPGDWALQRKQLALTDKFYQEQVAWLKQQPQEGREQLGTHIGEDSSHILSVKLCNENLIFVGEYHEVPGIRAAAADWLLQLHRLEPKRTLVVFAESLYLDPLPREEAYPYTYSRRGVEGLQAPVDISQADTHPAYVHMQNQPSYRDFITRLANTQGIEVYPLEDATTVQRQEGQRKVMTTSGFQERNAGFARVMRAHMDRIRQKDPQALFVFYGGNGHISWSMPTSLPKMFADEFPVVVEMSSPSYALYSLSTLGNFKWAWEDGFFDPSITAKRLFYWKGAPETARQFGRQTGFDYRLIVPD